MDKIRHKLDITRLNPYQQLGLRRFNFRLIARLTGLLLIYMSASMVLPLAVSLYYHDGAQFALLLSAIVILMVGLFLRNFVGHHVEFELKEDESYWVTMTVWIIIPLCGTLPYLFIGGLASFTDAVFESFSGFTTTGSSVILHPEEMPEGLLVYRAFTQWIGGLGLMLFVVAILRKLTSTAVRIYEAEFSGTQQRKLHPHLSRSVLRMWTIYSLITVVMVVALMATHTRFVDAVCIAFSTVSTGGFLTHTGGMAILTPAGLVVVTFFMFLSGINVAVLYRFFTFRWNHIGRNEELRTYVWLFVVATAVSVLAFRLSGNGWETAAGYSIFHIASTISTCGLYLPKPQHWSFLVSVITFVLIIIGASAGSTGGGIKLRRIIILMKYVAGYFTRMLHPNAVTRVKMDGVVVEKDYINKIFAFVFLYIAFIVGGAFVLTFCGCTIPDSICMVAANISNLGPSPLINNLGGSLNYMQLPGMAKWVLVILMVAGRLELFALIAVFSPAYWRRG